MVAPAILIPLLTSLLGAAGGALSKSGKKKSKRMSNFTPEQNQLLQQLIAEYSGGQSSNQGIQQSNEFLQKLVSQDPETLKQFEQPHLRQFNEQTVPGLAARFSQDFGGTSGSGFQRTLANASTDLQERLAAMRSQLGMQAANSLYSRYAGLSSQILGARPFENVIYGNQGNWLSGAFTGAAQGLGAYDWKGNSSGGTK